MKSITSSANPTYRAWLRLATQPRQVRAQRTTLAEGVHLCEAVLTATHPVEAVIVRAGGGSEERRQLMTRLAALSVPTFELAAGLYDALGLVEHGVGLAVVIPVSPEARTPLDGDALYLDGLQDPGNVGALLRVAAAAGVRHVLASPQTAALWAPKVMRAAQGAHLRLDLREQVAAEQLAALSVQWIGTDLAAATSLWEADLPTRPVGWVLGAEGQGASSAALAVCAMRIKIPLASGVDSLNVATAAAVCVFERQRRLQARDGKGSRLSA
jgi:TrmH family RNA methyltransferase